MENTARNRPSPADPIREPVSSERLEEIDRALKAAFADAGFEIPSAPRLDPSPQDPPGRPF